MRLLAVWTRLELATSCVTGRHSNQLNYQTNYLNQYKHDRHYEIVTLTSSRVRHSNADFSISIMTSLASS